MSLLLSVLLSHPLSGGSSCCSIGSQHTLHAGGLGSGHRPSQGRGAAVCHPPPQLQLQEMFPLVFPPAPSLCFLLLFRQIRWDSGHRTGGARYLRAGPVRSLMKETSGRVAGGLPIMPVGLRTQHAGLGGGQTWAEFLGLMLVSVWASVSQCPQWGCCEHPMSIP